MIKPKWPLVKFLILSVGGILLHFLYDICGESVLVAPFSGVNESTAEHMKLLYFPFLAVMLLESRYNKSSHCFWQAGLKGIVAGLVAIPILFYTYKGVLGFSADWFNIIIFFIAAAITVAVEARTKIKGTCLVSEKAAKLLILAIGILFAVFTFYPPKIGLFQDPVTGQYGV